MGETGFRLLLQPPKTYFIENRDTSYRLEDHEGFWTLDHFERDVLQQTPQTFRSLGELEQFLILRLQEFKQGNAVEDNNESNSSGLTAS